MTDQALPFRTFLGYWDEHGNEMHCAHAKCISPEMCLKGCKCPVARVTDQAPELLREQVARLIASNTWELMDEHCAKHGYIGEQKREVTHGNLAVVQSFLRADSVIALLTRPPSERPVAQGELEEVCAEAYQVVGTLLSDTGQFDTEHGTKILDNLSEGRMVHKGVLPWRSIEKDGQRPVAQMREADIITGAMAIAKARGHDPDEPAPLSEMCTWDNAPVPWWKVFEEEAEACLKSVAPPSERPVAQVREAVAGIVRHYIESAVRWMPSEGTKGRNGLDANETIALLSKRMCAALTAERPETVRENLTAEEFAQVLPRPEAAVAWRVRVRVGSMTCHAYTERLPFEPLEGSGTVVLGEPEPLYAIQHEEPGRLTMTSVPRPSLPSPTKLCRHCGRPEIERGHEYTADGYCNGIG